MPKGRNARLLDILEGQLLSLAEGASAAAAIVAELKESAQGAPDGLLTEEAVKQIARELGATPREGGDGEASSLPRTFGDGRSRKRSRTQHRSKT